MSGELLSLELSKGQFDTIRTLLFSMCGIKLNEGKDGLVKSRLMKRLRMLGLNSFDQYIGRLQSDSSRSEHHALIDALTTNKTSFFRESQHFDFLRAQILPGLTQANRRIRIWSAGCSSGEEPYSIAIALREALSDIDRRDVRILATDISSRVLSKAREGIYEHQELRDVAPALVQKYFTRTCDQPEPRFRLNEHVRELIRFAPLNLMADWPLKGPFDVIFCRNVMIYFEKPTREQLVNRFWHLLEPGGYLLIGHSESLAGSAQRFRYVHPATYVK
jgi:chemotaxis protein methyltransferase CheR